MKKWTTTEDDLLKELASSKTVAEIAEHLQLSYSQVKYRMSKLGLKPFKRASISNDIAKLGDRSYKRRYEEALVELSNLQKEKEANLNLKSRKIQTYKIKKKLSTKESESTAVLLLSDWHYEETVKPQSVNHLNKYNENIATKCIQKTFQTAVKYIKLQQNETYVKTLVVALLGDFISGGIHDELKEGNSMLPGEAIWRVQNHIASGIEYILSNTDVNLIIPCSTGNHSRITEKQRVATDYGNSLEWLMYKNLELYFLKKKRVRFIVNEGYHTYLNVYDYTIRFHHGHSIRYNGGVGGIYIPVNKAIAQWNKSKRADLDCFGHFHQMRNGGTFISNGSVIGWNPYAIKIKADFEKPKQAFFMIDKRYFINLIRPIVLDNR